MALNAKMRSLVVGGVFAVVAGVAAIIWTPGPSTTRADLLDAGITVDFVPRQLACAVLLPDGGYAERNPIVAVSRTLNPDGTRDTIWPRKAALQARQFLINEDAACRVTAVLTWAQVADFEADVAESGGSCACSRPDAGACAQTTDGGAVPLGVLMGPGRWVGPGCVPKVCMELSGRSSWPAVCPCPRKGGC